MRIERTIDGILDAGVGLEIILQVLSTVAEEHMNFSDPVADLALAVVALEKETTKFSGRLRGACFADALTLKTAALYFAIDFQGIADVLMGLAG